MHEGTLRVKEVEFVVETAPGGRDGGRVGQHTHATSDLGQVTAGNVGRGFIADAELETSGAPVDKLDGALGLNDTDGGVDILGDDITTIE